MFLYLGSQIHYNQPSTGDEELNLRIDSAENKFYSLGKKFINHKINLTTRVKIFNALVRSWLTYGCQTWVLTNQQTDRIRACYTIMLRKMIRDGFKRKPDEFAYVLTNEVILQLCKKLLWTYLLKNNKRHTSFTLFGQMIHRYWRNYYSTMIKRGYLAHTVVIGA